MRKIELFACIIILITGGLFTALTMGGCSDFSENLPASSNGKTVPITFVVGRITEDNVNTRGINEPIVFVQEIGKGHFMETSIVPENIMQTRAEQSVANGVKCRMLIYRNSVLSTNYYKSVEFSVGTPISVDLPINSTFKVVCYSYNTTTSPDFLLADDNMTVEDIPVTTSNGLVGDYLRSEETLTTNDNGGTFTIKFKHVFSRAKLEIGTTISGQKISGCIADITPVATGTTFSPSTGNVKNGNNTTKSSFTFSTLNVSPIESEFINIIASNEKPIINMDQISFTGEQIPGTLNFSGLSFQLPQPLLRGKSYRIIQNYNTGAITYRYNDNRSGVILPEGQTIRFTFYNPFNDPFSLDAYEIINGQKISIVSTASTNGLTKDITIPSRNVSLGNRIIYFRYTNTKSSKVYETGVRMIQRGTTKINILTMGIIQMYNAAWEKTNPTTYLGTANSYGGYTAGIRPLLETNFGTQGGKAIPYDLKFYNLYNGYGDWYQVGMNYDLRDNTGNIIKSTRQILEENNIDILCLYWLGCQTPTPDQAKQILEWLEADPHRGLIFSFDYYKYYGEASTKVGTTWKSSTNSTNHWLLDALKLSDANQSGHGGGNGIFSLLKPGDSGYNNVEYQKIITGTDLLGVNVSNGTFRWVDNDYGWITRPIIEREGYIPVFVDNNNRVIIGLQPEKRVFFHGELQFLEGAVTGISGSATQVTGYGPYAGLMGNLYAWFAKRIVMGEKYE